MPHREKQSSSTNTHAARQVTALPSHEISGPRDAPVIVVLGGISATRHVTATSSDPRDGWWSDVVGPDCAIDTSRLRVLSFDWIDAGSDGSGRPARTVTTHDQADALARLLAALDIESVHAIIASSYGGMVALAFAERYAERCEELVVISAAHESHPMSTALRAVQRGIVELGLGTNRATAALSLARALGMTTYRSAREFAERFDPEPLHVEGGCALFPVEEYLRHHGNRFAASWKPSRFLALSLSCDLHRVDPRRITTPTTLVAAEGDTIVPREQIVALASLLGGPATVVDLPTRYGHDAFLTEPGQIGSIISSALTTSILS